MTFSTRQLLVAISLVAVMLAVNNRYQVWKRDLTVSHYPEFRVLEQFCEASNGDSLADIKECFRDLAPFSAQQAALQLPDRNIMPSDSIFVADLKDRTRFYFQFRDGMLVNHSASLGLTGSASELFPFAAPPLHIRIGGWLICAALLCISAIVALYIKTTRSADNKELHTEHSIGRA